jgi:[CysO sulfur-carrier protein]-S-L-cysteine hydrolase
MRILLPEEFERRLIEALARAGSREIGGILMGEALGNEVFRVKYLTIQDRGGTIASFIRSLRAVAGPLKRFFRDTNHEYTRFNYLGEWHSHPSFSLRPSSRDEATIRAIVDDPGVGANFAILMIVQLDGNIELKASVTLYLPGNASCEVTLVRE